MKNAVRAMCLSTTEGNDEHPTNLYNIVTVLYATKNMITIGIWLQLHVEQGNLVCRTRWQTRGYYVQLKYVSYLSIDTIIEVEKILTLMWTFTCVFCLTM